MRLQAVNNCSSFQIQLGISHFHPQALSSAFRNWKVHVFMGHNTAVFLWTINLHLPLDPYLKFNLKANFEGIVLLSKAAQRELRCSSKAAKKPSKSSSKAPQKQFKGRSKSLIKAAQKPLKESLDAAQKQLKSSLKAAQKLPKSSLKAAQKAT